MRASSRRAHHSTRRPRRRGRRPRAGEVALEGEPVVLEHRQPDGDGRLVEPGDARPGPSDGDRAPTGRGGRAAPRPPPALGGWASSGAPWTTTAAWSAFSVAHHSSPRSAAPAARAAGELVHPPRPASSSNSGRSGLRPGATTSGEQQVVQLVGRAGVGAPPRRGPDRWRRGRAGRWCRGRPADPAGGCTAFVRRSCSSASSRKV